MNHPEWTQLPLGQICTVNPKLKTSDEPSPETLVSFVPMSLIDESRGAIDRTETRTYTEVAKGYTCFAEADVLFAKITPCMENGKAAIARNLTNGIGFGSTEFHVLRASPSVLPEWLFQFVRQSSFRAAAASNFTGTAGQKRVPVDFVKSVKIPLPPLEEQERIVRILDEADALRTLRAEADRRTAELIPALFHHMFGDPATMGASFVELQSVCRRVSDGTHQPPPFASEGIPFLFVKNIVAGFIDFNTEKKISEQTFLSLTRHNCPERGDILYSTVGSYGVAVQVEHNRRFAFQRHIGHIKPDHDVVDSTFLTAQLNMPFTRAQADRLVRGVAQKTLNLHDLRKLQIFLPAKERQCAFAARVAEIRDLQEKQAASRRRLDELFDSLLHRAFTGQL